MQDRGKAGKTAHINRLSRWLELVAGTFLMAVAYKSIYDSARMVTGGFSGIGVIVRYLTENIVPGGIPMWLTNTLLNIPLFLASYILLGRRFVAHTFAGTFLLTVFIGILPMSQMEQTDYLLASVVGGVVCGAGVGLVLRSGATTGGTDMLAVVIRRFVRRYSVIRIMQFLDGLIILAGMMVFGIRISMYAGIAIYIAALVSDRILEGAKNAKVIWIISDSYRQIAVQIMERVGRGVTALNGSGMYSSRQRNVILCVVSKKQLQQVKEIVQEIDAGAFLIVGDVREVCGEGFVQNIQ